MDRNKRIQQTPIVTGEYEAQKADQGSLTARLLDRDEDKPCQKRASEDFERTSSEAGPGLNIHVSGLTLGNTSRSRTSTAGYVWDLPDDLAAGLLVKRQQAREVHQMLLRQLCPNGCDSFVLQTLLSGSYRV